jgi:hypothetical protein
MADAGQARVEELDLEEVEVRLSDPRLQALPAEPPLDPDDRVESLILGLEPAPRRFRRRRRRRR